MKMRRSHSLPLRLGPHTHIAEFILRNVFMKPHGHSIVIRYSPTTYPWRTSSLIPSTKIVSRCRNNFSPILGRVESLDGKWKNVSLYLRDQSQILSTSCMQVSCHCRKSKIQTFKNGYKVPECIFQPK